MNVVHAIVMTQQELELLIRLGLVEPVARTADTGKRGLPVVTEYRLTGDGRILKGKEK